MWCVVCACVCMWCVVWRCMVCVCECMRACVCLPADGRRDPGQIQINTASESTWVAPLSMPQNAHTNTPPPPGNWCTRGQTCWCFDSYCFFQNLSSHCSTCFPNKNTSCWGSMAVATPPHGEEPCTNPCCHFSHLIIKCFLRWAFIIFISHSDRKMCHEPGNVHPSFCVQDLPTLNSIQFKIIFHNGNYHEKINEHWQQPHSSQSDAVV